MPWVWRFFSYSTPVCASALRNFSLPLPLRIHQLVLFFYFSTFLSETSVKKSTLEQGGNKKPSFSIICWTTFSLFIMTIQKHCHSTCHCLRLNFCRNPFSLFSIITRWHQSSNVFGNAIWKLLTLFLASCKSIICFVRAKGSEKHSQWKRTWRNCPMHAEDGWS